MLYLLDKDTKTVKWNGIPLHEASSAVVKEETNGDFYLTVHYPITDSGIYQLIKEDMLIKAPAPVLGAQLFRIKKPVENDDSLDITAYHISDDVMKRSIRPVSVVGQSCTMALSQMVQNAKTGLGDFSFTSDIMDSRTFNTTETETLYSVLLDGKHSIVGTWEGELVRDNFALSIKRSRGADRGVIITTHKNLKSYQRTKNSQGVVTRIHALSTFRAEGAETDTVLTVTVDSPLIGNYPYINEKEYDNNDTKTIDELKKWAEAKFTNEGIDKTSDAIEIEAYELDGQVVNLGDIVNLKSWKHNIDVYKKAVSYEFDALTEKYISITFDDKPGVGGSGVSSGVANAADVILSANRNAQEVAIERAIKNANQAFDAEFEKRVEVINDGIEQAKAEAELYADTIKQNIDAEIDTVNQSMKAQSDEHDRQVADILSKTQSVEELANQAKTDAANAIAEAIRLDTIERQATEAKVANAKSQAIAEANELVETAKSLLSGQISNVSTDLSQTKEAIKLLATEATVGALTGRVSSAEASLQVQAVEIASRVRTCDFDPAKQRISTAESSITQLGNRITTEISETKALIPTSVGGRNLAQKTSKDWSTPYTSFSGSANTYPRLYNVLVDDLAVDDTLKSRIVLKYTNIVTASGQTARIRLQGDGNVTGWNAGAYNSGPAKPISGSGEMVFEHEFKITADHLKNKYWNWQFRTDYIASGSLQWKLAKVEKGPLWTAWTPAHEDLVDEISSVKTTITQTSQGVEQLTTSLATTNGKVTTAETKISQLISDVSSKVSQTDYNTLTGRVSSAETAITQNATEISKRLTSTQVNQAILIDKQIKDTRSDNQNPQWYWTNYPKQTVEEFKGVSTIGLTSESAYAILTTNVHWTDSSGGKIKQTAKTDSATFERYGTGTTWDPWIKIANSSDLANYTTKTEFQTVKETTSLYERVIGSTEANVKDKIARIVMADSLFMTEVKNKVDGTSTQVTQLSDSYAIKNLTNSGTVLNQLNLNKDGSVKIDGKLVQITGTTYIQDGVISSAKIASLDAGKITTGTLSAARIATNSIAGSHIAFDQAFVNKMTANEALFKQLFAQSAFIASVQAVTLSASKISGGILTATNAAMEVNLNAGQILYYTDQAALKRVLSGYPTQFIRFGTGTVTGKGSVGVTVIGSNRYGTESSNDGGFVGIRAWNGTDIDQIDVVGDTVRLASSAFDSADGWKVVTLPNGLEIDAYNSNHRASSRVKIGDVWLWKNSNTYSSMRDTINLIIDNLQLLHNNKTTGQSYSYTMPPKV